MNARLQAGDGRVRVEGGLPMLLKDPKRGFKHFGDFAMAVRREQPEISHYTQVRDERLRLVAAAPTTFGSELVGPDGGFAVPPLWSQEIWMYSNLEDPILPWTDCIPVEGNSLSIPTDETTPWGTDGIRGYWQTEGLAGTQTKPKLRNVTMRMNKILVLVPVSDELIDDATALAGYLPKRSGMSIRWRINEGVINGLGNGTPLGAVNGPAAIVQAKEASQATLTFDPNNFRRMIGRLPPGSYSRAIWLFGRDCMDPLLGVNFGSYFLNDFNIASDAIPPGLSQPAFKILGRPAYESQHTAAFSSQGDLMLLDMSYYQTIVRTRDPEIATSLHLYFDADAAAYRVAFRMDGQPKIANPIAQAKGSNTLSPFVQLAAR